eukprot:Awhi_evm1s14703
MNQNIKQEDENGDVGVGVEEQELNLLLKQKMLDKINSGISTDSPDTRSEEDSISKNTYTSA